MNNILNLLIIRYNYIIYIIYYIYIIYIYIYINIVWLFTMGYLEASQLQATIKHAPFWVKNALFRSDEKKIPPVEKAPIFRAS